MNKPNKVIGIRMEEVDIDALKQIGERNMRKVATEGRLAILNHIKKEK